MLKILSKNSQKIFKNVLNYQNLSYILELIKIKAINKYHKYFLVVSKLKKLSILLLKRISK